MPPGILEIVAVALTFAQSFDGNTVRAKSGEWNPMAVAKTQRPKKSTYERGIVHCRKCRTPIYVYRLALPDEFSVHCKRCNSRGIYSKRDIAIEALLERRKKPRT
jgi:hypothetical protein